MEIEKNEIEHLDVTNELIKDLKKDLEETCSTNIGYIQELNKYHWESKTEADEMEYANDRTLIET